MIYGIIAAIVLGVWGYIQSLRGQVSKHQAENAVLKSQAQEAQYKREIQDSKIKVSETERDYKNAEDDFHNKFGTDTGDTGSGGHPGS